MKAKIDVTIFHNGDMDILHASIYEELWKDYCTFNVPGPALLPGGPPVPVRFL